MLDIINTILCFIVIVLLCVDIWANICVSNGIRKLSEEYEIDLDDLK